MTHHLFALRRIAGPVALFLAAHAVLAQDEGGGPPRHGKADELLAPGIARFFPFAYPEGPAPYSHALRRPFEGVGEVPDGFRVKVAFARNDTVIDPPGVRALRHAAVVPITPGTSLYAT